MSSKHTKRGRKARRRAHHERIAREAMAAFRGRSLRAWLDSIRPNVERNLSAQQDAPCDREGDGWRGSIGGACPLQGEGFVDGLPWYFRARWDEWSFSVAATPDGDPVAAGFGDAPPGSFHIEGEAEGDSAFAGSWMSYSEGWRHIEASVAAYRTRGAL